MFYAFSKILPLFLLPLGFSLILLFFTSLFRTRWSLFIATFILWFFSLGLVSQGLWRFLESPWHRRPASDAMQADAIVVLSGSLHPAPGPSRLTEWHDPDRFIAGLNLFRAGKAPRLIFTGGISPFLPGQRPEGLDYLNEAVSLGIPIASISLTPPVVNTAEEAFAVSRLLSPPHTRVLLVTSAFHMRRAQRLFQRHGFRVLPFPVDFQSRGRWAGSSWRDPSYWIPSSNALNNSSRAIRELLGRFFYRTW